MSTTCALREYQVPRRYCMWCPASIQRASARYLQFDTYIHTYIPTHAHSDSLTHTHTHTQTHTSTHTQVYVYIYIDIYLSIYLSIYSFIYLSIYHPSSSTHAESHTPCTQHVRCIWCTRTGRIHPLPIPPLDCGCPLSIAACQGIVCRALAASFTSQMPRSMRGRTRSRSVQEVLGRRATGLLGRRVVTRLRSG